MAALAAAGLTLVSQLPSCPARAGRTLLTCEFVGERENLPGVGAGALDRSRPTRSRFAGSDRKLAEGPPAGTGGADFGGIPVSRTPFSLSPECACSGAGSADPYSTGGLLSERFLAEGALRVRGREGTSPNGAVIYQNIPTCPDPLGGGLDQIGLPALYQWTVGLSNTVTSHVRVELCLDVRSCQEEDDDLGQGMTTPIVDLEDEFGREGPPTLRAVLHRGRLHEGGEPGPSSCACQDQTLDLVSQPSDGELVPGGPPPWISLPDRTGDDEIENSMSFIGRGCRTITVRNDETLAPEDFLTLQLQIPASSRVRIRAAADSLAVCYIGGVPPGMTD